MNSGTMKAIDTINGTEGKCYAVVEGNMEEMFYLKNLEAKIEINKKELKFLGFRGTKVKTTGWKGTGSMTMYYVTSYFRKIIKKYIDTGIVKPFSITVQNEDEASGAGRQSVTLKNVTLDGVTIAKLDIDNTELEEDMNFTFEGVDLHDEFDKLELE